MSWQPPRAPSRPLTNVERGRRYKWRVKHDMIHIPGLDLPLRSVAALVKLHYLDECQSEDRQAIRAAFERYISETLVDPSQP